MSDGLGAINAVKEMMAGLGRPNDSLYEVALWEDMLRVEGDELFYHLPPTSEEGKGIKRPFDLV